MAIVRYTASADNTITNAFKEDMITRGTGSNMGAADSLEVFGIYAQASSASAELARTLIKFPATGTVSIKTDRDAGTIPASGSVRFYLKMYNVVHPSTLPYDYKLTVARVTNDWEEGLGLDMDGYTDITYNGTGSNWVNRTGDQVAHITKVVFSSATKSNYGAGSGANYIIMYDGPNQYNFWFDDGTADSAPSVDGTEVEVDIQSAAASAPGIAGAFQTIVNGLSGFAASIDSSTVYVTSSTAGVVTTSSVVGTLSGIALTVERSGSAGTPWTSVGGDFTTATADDFVDVSFPDGDEDVDVDITAIVENWIKSSSPNANYGLMVKMSSSYETYFSSSTGAATGSILHNVNGSKRSYYTKKFSARGTEFFFKRPALEARWDDSRRDDRGKIFMSSSLVPAADNLNTLYLYNYVGGKLTDIKGSTTEYPNLKLYYSSGSTPEGLPRTFIASNTSVNNKTAARISTGVYSVSFAINDDQFPTEYPYLVDVWNHETKEIHTGSAMLPKARGFSNTNPNSQYVLSVTNMREFYNQNETARFRVHIRKKDWSPTVYSKATTAVEAEYVQSASYEIYRVVDDEVVVPYGTGSNYWDAQTKLSYDVSGNYFDLSMKLLEPGYMYGIRISIYEDSIGSYREQPYTFKFKVNKYYDY